MTSDRAHVRVTVSVLLVRSEMVLLVEERNGGRTFLNEPVGHVKPRESLIEAAKRELAEEVGYIPRSLRLFAIYHTIHHHRNLSDSLRFAFLGKPGKRVHAWVQESDVNPLWVKRRDLRKLLAKVTRPASRRFLLEYLHSWRTPPTMSLRTLRMQVDRRRPGGKKKGHL